MQPRKLSLLASLSAIGLLSTLLVIQSNATPSSASAARAGDHENLQVLPKDIGRGQLGNLMLDFLSGLGLPRRAGEGCLHCHVGTAGSDRAQWDYASDAKPAKLKARQMLAMVQAINGTYLKELPGRSAAAQQVNCNTCHRGRLNPTPLPDVLRAQLAQGGIGALESTYAELHAEYFGANAYDFRVGTLIALGEELSDQGRVEEALRVHRLNAKFSADPMAQGGEILVLMRDAYVSDGTEAMLEAYHSLKQEHPASAFVPGLLPQLAWKLFRSGAKPAGFQLFELNFKEHPDSFAGTEDLAYGSRDLGDGQRALELAEAWLRKHPDHKQGLQLLAELQR